MIEIVNRNQITTVPGIEQNNIDQYAIVKEIIAGVKQRGDNALFEFTEKFDKVVLSNLLVSDTEIEEAYENIDPQVIDAIKSAIKNIREYHEKQTRSSWITPSDTGTLLGQLILPLERVGIYVPGGTASYPTSVLMNAIPAQVAGVKDIAMVTPIGKNGKLSPGVLVAAQELGIKEIYKIGGAHAVAALAYGTQTIKKVDKITGPGNIFVALAKREVSGVVDIDMIAGPSEVVILADEYARADYIAADLLAQAEHDMMASVILVTPSYHLADEVRKELDKQLPTLHRKSIAEVALNNLGKICLVDDLEEAFEVVNLLAPEHLEVMIPNPLEHIGKIKNAGAIFLGENSPVAVGDYFAGPNHVLPTNGTARFSSPLNVDDFQKKSSLVCYSKQEIKKHGHKIISLAEHEGLQAHAQSVKIRLND
ncbi:histidinol dehydrogenase [Bacillus haynesii]|uniref:histidinol dehydrogenase n=1 Tax=Bacillus haynesii TaxID=1925021 RepID=UPI00227E517E|nr:histidinol dehydrogenase [Bacillus haynesii]MCY9276770.1 histidinol dehydrogenase [Bacillus haynesii]MCY9402153.1 histidinol dehydrogenase [Bacillus haynesii]